MSGFRKILCAIDFSEASRAALEIAVDLAAQLDASVTLAHIYPIPYGVYGIAEPGILKALAESALPLLEEWKEIAKGRVREVDTVNVSGVVWDRIVGLARDGDYDLIVVGTHGRTGIQHVLLGSVAERVVRHAPCPVLVARQAKTS